MDLFPSFVSGESPFLRLLLFLVHFRIGIFPLLLWRWRVMFKKDSTRFASSKAGAVDAGADHEKRKEEVVETIRPVASILLDILMGHQGPNTLARRIS